MIVKTKTVEPSWKEDFRTAVKQAGYSENDFEVSETEDDFPSGERVSITGTVFVTFKKTGISRTFQSGNRTAWVVDFEKDLRAEVFTKG